MSAPPRVAILLATYNGARYLPEQLASIAAQRDVDWSLCWRDDGSTDSSRAILEEFTKIHGGSLELSDQTNRIGATASFLALLRAALAARPDADYFAFADQDDVWLPDKLARATGQLADATWPALYCARQMLTDAMLRPLGHSPPMRQPIGFPAALAQNIATGNTVVLNRAAASLLARSQPPATAYHDWWSYLLVAAAGGRIMADNALVIRYRQHGGNMVGARSAAPLRALRALRRGPAPFLRLFHAQLDALASQPHLLAADTHARVAGLQEAMRGTRWRRPVRAWRLGLRRQSSLQTMALMLWLLLA